MFKAYSLRIKFSALATLVTLLLMVFSLSFSFQIAKETRLLSEALKQSYQQTVLTERMSLLAHYIGIQQQLGLTFIPLDDELQQHLREHEALAPNIRNLVIAPEVFGNTQSLYSPAQQSELQSYQAKVHHFIQDKSDLTKQLQALEQSEARQYNFALLSEQRLQALSDKRLTTLWNIKNSLLIGLLLAIILLIALNVTQFRLMRKKSQQQEKLNTLLTVCLNKANDAVVITEVSNIEEPTGPLIIYVNETFTRMTGYSTEDVFGKTPRILQGPLTQRKELAKIRYALMHWQPVRVEVLNYTKTKTLFWVEIDITPITDENGWITHWLAIQRDITERKVQQTCFDELELSQQTSQEKQWLSEYKLQQLFDLSPLGICLLTMTGEFIEVN
ncbi:MAG: PAS domain-containing protein, partial [Methylovulum sp.]|nr:PAS domain-containing protein [Methylovulum sp.]